MTYTSTELYNKILQAMDNYKPIFVIADSGVFQCFVPSKWNGIQILLHTDSDSISILPSSGDTTYTPTNIRPYHVEPIDIGGGDSGGGVM